MIEDWIDELTKTAGLVAGASGKNVLSYRLFSNSEYPESLTVFPCALTYVENVSLDYGIDGTCRNIWEGFTEFHLTSDLNRKKLPEVMLYYRKIRNAFASNMTLGGKVSYFTLRGSGESSIAGPVELRYGNEKFHLGLVAYWRVKEIETGVATAMSV